MNTKTHNTNENHDVDATITAFVQAMSAEEKAALIAKIQGQHKASTEVKAKKAKINQEKLLKEIATQERLAEAAKRRQVVAKVLTKMYKGKQFTVSELNEQLNPLVSKWQINLVAEMNNILRDIGAKVVGTVKREAGRGRRENIWMVG